MTATIFIDGAARGNPGPAAFAYVIKQEGRPTVEEKRCLGKATNNVAEYTALVRALERAEQLGIKRLHIRSDSELLVKQMNGQYKVKNPDLRALYEEAKRLIGSFDHVAIRHVPRSENPDADRLCNEALDGASGADDSPAPRRSRTMAGPSQPEAVREEALLCLRSAAICWANGQLAALAVEDVWDQLWSILEENGVLKTSKKAAW
jgi:ribonuclease HI